MSGDVGESTGRSWTVTMAQSEWLGTLSEKYKLSGGKDEGVSRLIVECNRATAATKRIIFTQLRCHNCTQMSRGVRCEARFCFEGPRRLFLASPPTPITPSPLADLAHSISCRVSRWR